MNNVDDATTLICRVLQYGRMTLSRYLKIVASQHHLNSSTCHLIVLSADALPARLLVWWHLQRRRRRRYRQWVRQVTSYITSFQKLNNAICFKLRHRCSLRKRRRVSIPFCCGKDHDAMEQTEENDVMTSDNAADYFDFNPAMTPRRDLFHESISGLTERRLMA